MFVVFDLDGTLARIEHRVHHVRGGNRNWSAFFAACVDDQPNHAVIETLKAHCDAMPVEVYDARQLEAEAA